MSSAVLLPVQHPMKRSHEELSGAEQAVGTDAAEANGPPVKRVAEENDGIPESELFGPPALNLSGQAEAPPRPTDPSAVREVVDAGEADQDMVFLRRSENELK